MVGRIMEVLRHNNLKVKLVPVNAWKGQLSKELVIDRIADVMGPVWMKVSGSQFRTHEWDALGIGLWAKGLLKCS